ncbi:hypothetical protein J2X31_002301 [Flavobacterium arsenatis]|uniref:Lipopolysaccharide biosynthesis protein n=1 Tax=Flavobacterium arsenatis TaxID=1484332 RepID=A0ABU1TQN6_9FLAO|nr:hypothetical protein [Flavobacterium arsenatis]MDR6968284.1 hypothetical protein [Flavobacterium arsenatis]
MELGKTLIIYESIQYLVPFIEEKGVKVFHVYKQLNIFEKLLRRISLKYEFHFPFLFDRWTKKIAQVDTVIIFATAVDSHIAYIIKNYSHKRIIIWYWNPVSKSFVPSKFQGNNVEFWSFDQEDCEKYNIRFNSTFYIKDIHPAQDDSLKREIDVIYLGMDKGRKKNLKDIENQLNAQNITTYFHIIPDFKAPNPENIKSMDYGVYLSHVNNAKVILDFLQAGQAGQTIRPMESIFLKRKLLTNDTTIVHMPFYDRNNIFILGLDNLDDLYNFINSPYKDIDKSILDYYNFENWIKRFDHE